MKRSLIVICAALVAACSNAPKYAPVAADVDAPKLRLVAGPGMRGAFAYYRDNAQCVDPKKVGRFGRGGSTALSLASGPEWITTRIPAGRTAYIQLAMSQGGSLIHATCSQNLAIDPVAGASYEIVFSAMDGKCTTEVYKVVNGSKLREESAREAPRCQVPS